MSTAAKSNAELLADLDAAFKSITDISDFGDSILQPEKFDEFVRQMENRTVVLPDARFIRMDAQQTDIDRIGFVGRILRSGSDSVGASRTLAENEFAKPATATNKLIAKELQAVTSLRDRALRRNIEREGFESTLVDLFGEAAGRDFEEYALLGDVLWTHNVDDVLSKTDGWLKKAANKIFGRDVSGQAERDFDPASDGTGAEAAFPLNLFQSMIDAIPKQFLQDPSEFRMSVTWDVFDGYRTQLQKRGTDLGDRAITDNILPPYKGIPVIYTPTLGRAAAVDLEDEANVIRDRVEGEAALLWHPDNTVWGVFHEVTVEPEREAKARRTDYVLTIESDAHYEDENAAVAAFIDKANPETS